MTKVTWQTFLGQETSSTRGQFLEGPEKFSHPQSRSKISNLMITELFYSHILDLNRSSLHTRSFRRIQFFVFRYRWTKNGFTCPKRFRGIQKTRPRPKNLNSRSWTQRAWQQCPWGNWIPYLKTIFNLRIRPIWGINTPTLQLSLNVTHFSEIKWISNSCYLSVLQTLWGIIKGSSQLRYMTRKSRATGETLLKYLEGVLQRYNFCVSTT